MSKQVRDPVIGSGAAEWNEVRQQRRSKPEVPEK